MDPEVIRYIAENRERFTHEAIDSHLLSAGHSRAEIDAAWNRLGEVHPSPSADRTFRRAFLGSVAALYGITFLVYAVGFPLFISAILLIALLLAAMVSIALVKTNRSAGRGMATGLLTALVIPFVFLVIVAGLCTALTGAPFADVQ